MKLIVISFLVLFVMPMGGILWLLPPSSLAEVALTFGGALLLGAAALLLPRLLAVLGRRRPRTPTRALTHLDWPQSLTRGEMEQFAAAWLRAHGWAVTLTTDPQQDKPDVYLMARRSGGTLAVVCDQAGEELNPASIRAFALAATQLGAERSLMLTLLRGKLPSTTESAARQAGVALLRVADLGQLDAIVPPAPAEAPAAA